MARKTDKRGAVIAAAFAALMNVQSGAAMLSWSQQQQQEETQTTQTMEETARISIELEEQKNKTRMIVASSEGAPAAAEEQEKQESTAPERLLQYPSAIALQNSIRSALTGVGIVWTIIYANFHALGRLFSKRRFCALGEEWTFTASPEKPPVSAGTARLFGWLELLALVLIDAAIFFSILQQFALMAVVVTAVMHPWDTFKQYGFAPFKIIWDLINGS